MNVRIRAFAQLREVLGDDRILEVPDGTSLEGLLRMLGDGSAEAYDALFDGSGALNDYVLLMKNRKPVTTRQLSTVTLSEGDEIALYPPVAGG